jgi:hypothetical protein
MTSSQGRKWVVGCGHYHIVGDNLAHNYRIPPFAMKHLGVVNALIFEF